MKRIRFITSFILSVALLATSLSFDTYAASTYDPSIPNIDSVDLTSEGIVTWVKSAAGATFPYKKFEVQLLKRTSVNEGGLIVHKWKTHGSKKSVEADEESFDVTFTSVGYYRVQIRGYNLDGNYSEWTESTGDGVPVTEDDISPGGSGGGSWWDPSSGGPGVVSNYPNGGMNLIIGPNGEIYYSNYHQSNQTTGQQYLGPGYSANSMGGTQITGPGATVGGGQSAGGYYMTVPSPFAGNNQAGAQTGGNSYLYNNTGNANNTYPGGSTNVVDPNSYNANPGYNQGGGGAYNAQTIDSYKTPNVTAGLEVGWHVDNYGRFYYQGNGVVLKNSWFKIDGYYYNFDQGGYMRAKTWYKDPSNQSWYYLDQDGKMVVGWQQIDNAWYYFNPNNGTGYGSLYVNTSLFIQDAMSNGYYAFGTDGRMIANAWYGGYYYGSDGRRTNS